MSKKRTLRDIGLEPIEGARLALHGDGRGVCRQSEMRATVAFIDEQLTPLGGPGEEVPWPVANPAEWDVISPMPLVLARQNSEARLPTWDPESGDEVD